MSSAERIGAGLATVALLFAVLTAVAGGSAAANSVATASANNCDLTTYEQRHLGASYVTSLKVTRTTCSKGKSVTKAFHECRFDNGGKNGKCRHEVSGYSCEEHRYDAVPQVQYNSRVKCEKGDKVIRHTYTQNV